MPTPDLLTNVRDYLVAEGVGRDPRTAGAVPPIWREPQDGAPAPGDRSGIEDSATATISLFRTAPVSPSVLEQRYVVKPTIDVVLRTDKPPTATAIEEAIRAAFVNPAGDPAGAPAMNWMMGALRVIDSRVWREFQPLEHDAQAYTSVGSFYFELYTG